MTTIAATAHCTPFMVVHLNGFAILAIWKPAKQAKGGVSTWAKGKKVRRCQMQHRHVVYLFPFGARARKDYIITFAKHWIDGGKNIKYFIRFVERRTEKGLPMSRSLLHVSTLHELDAVCAQISIHFESMHRMSSIFARGWGLRWEEDQNLLLHGALNNVKGNDFETIWSPPTSRNTAIRCA